MEICVLLRIVLLRVGLNKCKRVLIKLKFVYSIYLRYEFGLMYLVTCDFLQILGHITKNINHLNDWIFHEFALHVTTMIASKNI